MLPWIPDDELSRSVQVGPQWKDVGVIGICRLHNEYIYIYMEVRCWSSLWDPAAGASDTSTTWADLCIESPQSTWAYYLFIRSTLFTETLAQVENCYSICMQNMKKAVKVEKRLNRRRCSSHPRIRQKDI
jgi:hypothetical protein